MKIKGSDPVAVRPRPWYTQDVATSYPDRPKGTRPMNRPRTATDVKIQTRIVADAQSALQMAAASYVAEPDGATFRDLKKAMHDYELAFFDYTEIMNDLEPLWHAPDGTTEDVIEVPAEDIDPVASWRSVGRILDRYADPE